MGSSDVEQQTDRSTRIQTDSTTNIGDIGLTGSAATNVFRDLLATSREQNTRLLDAASQLSANATAGTGLIGATLGKSFEALSVDRDVGGPTLPAREDRQRGGGFGGLGGLNLTTIALLLGAGASIITIWKFAR